jgi:outer membrane protein assembly factor BamB
MRELIRICRVPCRGLGCLALLLAADVGHADWPQYRGPNHDGTYPAGIRSDWIESPPAEVWRTPLDPGLSSLAVAGGRVFTQVRRPAGGQQQEFCVALDARTGAELWATALDIAVYPDGGVGSDDGPRSTPAVADDAVMVLTSRLKLWCLDAASGEERWSRDLRADYGGAIIPWQNAASPIVLEDLAIVNANGPGQCLMAFHIADGTVAWKGHNDGMTHASPVSAEIDGTRQVIFFAQTGLVGVAPDSGEVLWRHALNYNSTSVAASPVVAGDLIYASRAYPVSLSAARAGAVVIRLDQEEGEWATSQVWYRTNQLMNHWSTPVIYEGHIYGHFGQSTLTFKCLELETGVEKWSVPGFGYGSVLRVGEDLLVLSASGELVLVRSNPNEYTERARIRPLTGKCWNVPAVSEGRIYMRSTLEAVCVDVALTPVDLPRLRLLTGPVIDGDGFRFRITTEDGSPIDEARVAGIEVQTAAGLSSGAGTWRALTNGVVVTNRELHVHDPGGLNLPGQFFRAFDRP